MTPSPTPPGHHGNHHEEQRIRKFHSSRHSTQRPQYASYERSGQQRNENPENSVDHLVAIHAQNAAHDDGGNEEVDEICRGGKRSDALNKF